MVENEIISIENTLTDSSISIPEKVHESRKRCKFIRAVLRLYRDSLAYSDYYRGNSSIRDVSRELSELREISVFSKTSSFLLGKLSPNLRDENPEHSLAQIESDEEELLSLFKNEKDLLRGIGENLETIRYRIHAVKLKNKGFESIEKGLKRTYRQCIKNLDKLKVSYEREQIHELRKKSKYLACQLELLSPLYPEILTIQAKSMNMINDDLGNYRDYALCLDKFRKNDFYKLNQIQSRVFAKIAKEEMEKSLNRVLQNYDRFLVEKPGAFAKRIKKYYEVNITMSIL